MSSLEPSTFENVEVSSSVGGRTGNAEHGVAQYLAPFDSMLTSAIFGVLMLRSVSLCVWTLMSGAWLGMR
jgi:hypothetical protein